MNLFGLLPFAAPDPTSLLALIFIGILPILLGISMWLQQKLNPAPTDPTQQMIFAWMPWIFMFMLGGFASGLVVYWIANNVITFASSTSSCATTATSRTSGATSKAPTRPPHRFRPTRTRSRKTRPPPHRTDETAEVRPSRHDGNPGPGTQNRHGQDKKKKSKSRKKR